MSINARSVLVQGVGRDFDFVSESLRKHCCDVEIRIITGKGPLTRIYSILGTRLRGDII